MDNSFFMIECTVMKKLLIKYLRVTKNKRSRYQKLNECK